MNRTADILNKVLALLFLLVLVLHWQLLMVIFKQSYAPANLTIYTFFPILFLILNLSCAVGLFNGRSYSYWLAYFTIPFSTIVCLISYVPFVDTLFPAGNRNMTLFILNGIVWLLVFVAHVMVTRKRKPRTS